MGTINFAVSPEFGRNAPLLVHETEVPVRTSSMHDTRC